MTTEIVKRDCYDVLNPVLAVEDSEGYLKHLIEPANNNQNGLNNSQVVTFSYAGDSKPIRLHPMYCGFKVRAAFRTRSTVAAGAAGDNNQQLAANREAKITLAPNWFWHLFTDYKLKVANLGDVEKLTDLGVYADTMALFKGSEYKRTYGEMSGYIPDEGSGEADYEEFTVTNAAIAVDQPLPENHVKIVSNSKYNAGFARRYKRYNYPLPVDDTTGLRYIEEFIPLSQISGFFSIDKVLLNTSFVIQMTRKADSAFQNAVFGMANTNMDFGNTPDTGLKSITLMLQEQKPTLSLASELSSIFENSNRTPIPLSFLKATCNAHQMGNSKTFTVVDNSVTVPRYVIVGFKGAPTTSTTNQAPDEANQESNVARNFSLLANANIANIKVTINGDEYPNINQDAEFSKNYFSEFYAQYTDTCSSLGQEPCLTMDEFKNLYSVFAFNCSDQKKKLSTKNTNLKVIINRKAVPEENRDRKNPRDLMCYVLVLEDKLLKLDANRGILTDSSVVV